MLKSESHSSRHPGTLHPRQKANSPAESSANPEQRQRMIAEAAYFMAEHRGFNAGDPVQDWLAAEAEIDTVLRGVSPATPEETAAYAHLRVEVRKAFSQMQDFVDAAAVRSAFDRGVNELRYLGSHSTESIHRAAAAVRQDLARAAERMGPSWEHFSERGAGLFSVWKNRSSEFLNRSAEAVRHWLHTEPRGPEH